MEKYTKTELKKITHSLGIDIYKMMMSHNKKDKVLPNEFYRNYYQQESNEILDDLVEKGFANKTKNMGLNFYHINSLGRGKFREEISQMMIYQPRNIRGIEYLNQRINFYCYWQGYRFGKDNSDHVISAYANYYLKGHYMSHTTTDCVKVFKNELRALKDIIVRKVTSESTYK